MSATLGRSPSRDSHLSVGISSPLLGINRDLTPPVVPEPGIAYLHDRLNYLESQISDIRSVVLTKDSYVERRNREDQHIRREFEGQKSALEQIDVDLTALKTEVIQVKNNLATLTHETTFLRKDVDRIEKVVEQLQVETKLLRVDVGECRNDITHLSQTVYHLSQKMDSRFDKVNTRFNKLEMRLGGVSIRVESMDFRMKQSEKVRFNSLALQANSPISAVPKIDDDGKVCYPEWFPKTVIRFWGLRKPSRLHRLVELAEFYELEGYQAWGHSHPEGAPFDEAESSDASDEDLTLEEAVAKYPDACHHVLGLTLGLNYRKLLKIAREGDYVRAPKRDLDEMASSHPSSKSRSKPAKSAKLGHNTSPRTKEKRTVVRQDSSSVPTLPSPHFSIHYGLEDDLSENTKARMEVGDFRDYSQGRLLRGVELRVARVHDQQPVMPRWLEDEAGVDAAAPASAQPEPADTAAMDDVEPISTIATEIIRREPAMDDAEPISTIATEIMSQYPYPFPPAHSPAHSPRHEHDK